MAENQSVIDVPDRTGQSWQMRSVNARRLVFLVIGPPKKHGSEWRHPTLVLLSDNRPEKTGTQSSVAEPRIPVGLRFMDPTDEDMDTWEEATGMTRLL